MLLNKSSVLFLSHISQSNREQRNYYRFKRYYDIEKNQLKEKFTVMMITPSLYITLHFEIFPNSK